MRKTSVISAIALIPAALLLAGSPGVWAQKGPVKVGLLVPQSGPLAANGKDMINGLTLFFEEQGNRLAGREIKLIIEDDEGKPATGLTKARGLVEEQAVHVLMGPLSAAIGYAVAPYIDGKKVPAIFPIVSAEDITQRKRSPYIVRTGWSSAQPSHPFGKWVYDNLGYRRIAMIGYDFAFGWEVAAGFQRTFEEAGGQVVQKLWPPLGTADFGPYLAQLRRDVDAIYAVFSGADGSAAQLHPKRLELLKETIPRLARVAVLWTPGNPGHRGALAEAEAAARTLGIQLQPLEVRDPTGLEGTFSAMTRNHPDALLVFGDALFFRERARIVGLAVKGRLPTMFIWATAVEDGGLMSYGEDRSEFPRRAAAYVDRILKGARAGDLPVERAAKFDLAINLKTAKALGLTIPESILARATKVIGR